MADIYLGPTMSGAPLPPFRWSGGGAPDFPHDYSKQVEKETMLDGSTRFNFKSHNPRKWTLSWAMLTPMELADFIALNQLNQALYFQNNWEDATWRQVVITRFEYAPHLKLGHCTTGEVGSSTAVGRWSLDLTLEEVI